MAAPTLSTRLSRRSMLAGGAAVMAAPLPAFAALPVAGLPEAGGLFSDAGLWRRIAAAHDCLAAYRRADAACAHLHRTLSDCPDFPDHRPRTPEECDRWDALLDRAGITAADARCERLYDCYEAALAAAFAVPARTLAGVHGKLQLAVTAVKQEQSSMLDPADCTYLDGTLGDLGRLAARCTPPASTGEARIRVDRFAHTAP